MWCLMFLQTASSGGSRNCSFRHFYSDFIFKDQSLHFFLLDPRLPHQANFTSLERNHDSTPINRLKIKCGIFCCDGTTSHILITPCHQNPHILANTQMGKNIFFDLYFCRWVKNGRNLYEQSQISLQNDFFHCTVNVTKRLNC